MTAWLILFIPLIAALVITFAARKYKDLSSYISIGAVVLCFILSIDPILTLLKDPHMKPIEHTYAPCCYICRFADTYIFKGIYARRARFFKVFCVYVIIYIFNAWHCPFKQLYPDIHILGACRAFVLSFNRLLL